MNLDIFLDEDSISPDDLTGGMTPMIFPEDVDIDLSEGLDSLPEELPIIPLRDMILFPGVLLPVMVGRAKTKKLVNALGKKENKHVLVAVQKEPETEDPDFEDLVHVGTVGEIVRVMQVQDNVLTVIIQGKRRVELTGLTRTEPYLNGTYRLLEDNKPAEDDIEFQALITTLKEKCISILGHRGELPQPVLHAIKNVKDPEAMLNFACTNFPSDMAEKLSLLMIGDLKTRAYRMLSGANTMLQLFEMKQMIQQKTRKELDKQQRDFFLQQQLKVIKDELNEGEEDDLLELQKKGKKKNWDKKVYDTFKKEVKKLQKMNSQSPDYSIQMQYLQTMLDLPWDDVTEDNFNIPNAAKILDKDHFGLEKVKERILEHLAVLKLKGDLRSPIICLYGPPGVGKTSLGQSIASALNRSYVRISLGGLHDEAEIRGHRRTYIGAMPGRIIKGFVKAKSANPVFVLDEIDKLAQDYKGDPSSALLEVLDPEQNNTFHDNYLDIDYDLSKALFIATANNIGAIPGPLRDRMEMIEVSGYILEEKIEIAHRHLLPRALENHGLSKKNVKVSKKTIAELIERYTRESGVRELEKCIASLLRKVAKRVADITDRGEEMPVFTIKPEDLKDYLGAPKYTRDQYEGNRYAGVVTGLAWTSVGGEILLVESALSPSKNGRMTITGNLGEVMKESALLALEYVKSHADLYDIPKEVFDYWNVHIHVPEGAIPKDGPSAGITLVTSLISTFTQRKVRSSIAMTGEITLRGKVLPVGGIKEKILAAKRSGIKTILLCEENRKDIEEIKDVYISGLEFIYVTDIKEVIEHAVMDTKVNHSVDLMKHVNQFKKSSVECKDKDK